MSSRLLSLGSHSIMILWEVKSARAWLCHPAETRWRHRPLRWGLRPRELNLRQRQTTTPTKSGYLNATAHESTNKSQQRLRQRELQISDQDYVHGWTTPRQSGYLYTIASQRAWVDDADNERLPPRHRIRPRERLPDPENCPREHISDKEHFTPR